MTVKDLADKLDIRVKDVLGKLLMKRLMMTINSTLDTETATMLAREFGADVQMRSFEEELIADRRRGHRQRGRRRDARAGRHGHGSRRPRQDQPARRHPRSAGRRARSRRHHAAHRRVSRHDQRPQHRVPRYAGPRRVHADARARRQGHRHRRSWWSRPTTASCRRREKRSITPGRRTCRSSWRSTRSTRRTPTPNGSSAS